MAPKQSDGGNGQKTNDALYVFESLFNVATPISVNVNEIADRTGAKPNTIAKRFSILRQRYPGLNIQTTTTGSAPSPGRVQPPPTPTRKQTVPPKSSKTASKNPGRKAAINKTKRTPEKPKQNDDLSDGDEEDQDGSAPQTEADTTAAEAADDEATPMKSANIKRKRALSTTSGSSKARNISKRAKSITSTDSSSDELTSNTFLSMDGKTTQPRRLYGTRIVGIDVRFGDDPFTNEAVGGSKKTEAKGKAENGVKDEQGRRMYEWMEFIPGS